MASKMMFVYVDAAYNIKAISPVADDTHDYRFVMFPVDDVRMFLEGKSSLSQFKLVQNMKDITKFDIMPKIVELDNIRQLDSFLMPVQYKNDKAEIQIIHFLKSKKLEFRIHKSTRASILASNSTEAGNVVVVSVPKLQFYFCANEDPCFLIHSIEVVTDYLINEWGQTIFYEDELDLTMATIFTKKIFREYSYEEIDE